MTIFERFLADDEVLKSGWDSGDIFIGIIVIVAAICIIPIVCCCFGIYGVVNAVNRRDQMIIVNNQIRGEPDSSRRDRYQNFEGAGYQNPNLEALEYRNTNPSNLQYQNPNLVYPPYPNYAQPSAPYLNN